MRPQCITTSVCTRYKVLLLSAKTVFCMRPRIIHAYQVKEASRQFSTSRCLIGDCSTAWAPVGDPPHGPRSRYRNRAQPRTGASAPKDNECVCHSSHQRSRRTFVGQTAAYKRACARSAAMYVLITLIEQRCSRLCWRYY